MRVVIFSFARWSLILSYERFFYEIFMEEKFQTKLYFVWYVGTKKSVWDVAQMGLESTLKFVLNVFVIRSECENMK